MPAHPSATDAAALDPRAYLERIGFSPAAAAATQPLSVGLLRALHEAHLLAVPFENLSIHLGQPIILDEAALYDKIVSRRRGGFCYELNGLFAWLLRRLGFAVTYLSAGVAQADGGYSPDFDHMALLVPQVEGADWLVDVGFGESFRRPLRLQADVEQDGADGHGYRLLRNLGQHAGHAATESDASQERPLSPQASGQHGPGILERREEPPGTRSPSWQPQYRFTLQAHTLTEFVPRCWYQQTSPDSHFTQRRICSLALPQGRITLSEMRLITTDQAGRQERIVQSEDEYRAILAESFGMVL